MSWVATAVVGGAVLSAGSAYASASSANANARRNAEIQEAEAQRRYALESGVAVNQMEEQNQLAMEKMTEISREFLKVKGQAEVLRAESGVSGVTAQRMEANTRKQFSEAKGKVAKEINTNVINIAQGMLAKKIDTETVIAKARAYSKRSVGVETIVGGIQGGLQGYSLGRSLSAGSVTSNAATSGDFVSQGVQAPSTYTDMYFTPIR